MNSTTYRSPRPSRSMRPAGWSSGSRTISTLNLLYGNTAHLIDDNRSPGGAT